MDSFFAGEVLIRLAVRKQNQCAAVEVSSDVRHRGFSLATAVREPPSRISSLGCAVLLRGRTDLIERLVADGIQSPILVVEMPPFGFVHPESLGLHRTSQQLSIVALPRCA